MKDSLFLRFIYGTVPGRVVLKLLVQPAVSRLGGRILSSRISGWIVPYYRKRHHIDMKNVEVPEGGFCSFNAFFTRKRRLWSYDLTDGHLISPCDGYLTVAEIEEGTVFSIKNTLFSVEDLLKNRELAEGFQGGTALIFRLTPVEYHRYCYAADGDVIRIKKIPGKLHCVRPIALRTLPVFVQNSREYQVIHTERFGMMVQMEIGALLVGKIRNNESFLKGGLVQAGEEKGYFEFGGSTIVLLLQKDMIRLNGDLYGRKDEKGEIKLQMGEYVAESVCRNDPNVRNIFTFLPREGWIP